MDIAKTWAFAAAGFTILMQVASQLLLRSQVAGFGQLSAVEVILKSIKNPLVWLAILALVAGMVAWFVTLSRLSLNQAYPLVALTIPLTAALSTWLFSEPLPMFRAIGIGVIIVGVLMVARS